MKINEANLNGKCASNIIELVACNIDDFSTDTPLVSNPKDILIYPNPTSTSFIVETGQSMKDNSISVFNILGQELNFYIEAINSKKARIDLSGNIPGVYFVRFKRNDGFITRKISYVPW